VNLDNFGMDTITLPGGLESKLQASIGAGFSQIMLWSKDLVGYPGGLDAAVALVRASGLRVTGIQVMRDYEGLQGTLHEYKVDVAKNLLQICKAVGAPLLLVCSSTSQHASGDTAHIARDLAKLANLAVPLGIRVGFEAFSWGRHINQYMQAWEVVELADHANLGVVIDSFHILANRGALEDLDAIPGRRIVMVQLSDFMWREIRTPRNGWRRRAICASSPARASIRWSSPTWCGACIAAAIAATTALKCSTTITCRCHRPWWPSVRAARPSGSPTRCCGAACGCAKRWPHNAQSDP
jgi:sugar phosphate isomerase/epimerase